MHRSIVTNPRLREKFWIAVESREGTGGGGGGALFLRPRYPPLEEETESDPQLDSLPAKCPLQPALPQVWKRWSFFCDVGVDTDKAPQI